MFKRIVKRLLFLFSPRAYKEFHDIPFDINKILLESALSKVVNVNRDLSRIIENIRISDGTLLGLLRDGRLIHHDNDIDFDLEYSIENVMLVRAYARNSGWVLGREVEYKRRTQQLTFFDGELEIFDFIFWDIGSRFATNFSEPKCIRIMDPNFLKKLKNFELDGAVFKIPENETDWLEYRYGKSWNVPENSKGNWQETCGDIGEAWWLD